MPDGFKAAYHVRTSAEMLLAGHIPSCRDIILIAAVDRKPAGRALVSKGIFLPNNQDPNDDLVDRSTLCLLVDYAQYLFIAT